MTGKSVAGFIPIMKGYQREVMITSFFLLSVVKDKGSHFNLIGYTRKGNLIIIQYPYEPERHFIEVEHGMPSMDITSGREFNVRPKEDQDDPSKMVCMGPPEVAFLIWNKLRCGVWYDIDITDKTWKRVPTLGNIQPYTMVKPTNLSEDQSIEFPFVLEIFPYFVHNHGAETVFDFLHADLAAIYIKATRNGKVTVQAILATTDFVSPDPSFYCHGFRSAQVLFNVFFNTLRSAKAYVLSVPSYGYLNYLLYLAKKYACANIINFDFSLTPPQIQTNYMLHKLPLKCALMDWSRSGLLEHSPVFMQYSNACLPYWSVNDDFKGGWFNMLWTGGKLTTIPYYGHAFLRLICSFGRFEGTGENIQLLPIPEEHIQPHMDSITPDMYYLCIEGGEFLSHIPLYARPVFRTCIWDGERNEFIPTKQSRSEFLRLFVTDVDCVSNTIRDEMCTNFLQNVRATGYPASFMFEKPSFPPAACALMSICRERTKIVHDYPYNIIPVIPYPLLRSGKANVKFTSSFFMIPYLQNDIALAGLSGWESILFGDHVDTLINELLVRFEDEPEILTIQIRFILQLFFDERSFFRSPDRVKVITNSMTNDENVVTVLGRRLITYYNDEIQRPCGYAFFDTLGGCLHITETNEIRSMNWGHGIYGMPLAVRYLLTLCYVYLNKSEDWEDFCCKIELTVKYLCSMSLGISSFLFPHNMYDFIISEKTNFKGDEPFMRRVADKKPPQLPLDPPDNIGHPFFISGSLTNPLVCYYTPDTVDGYYVLWEFYIYVYWYRFEELLHLFPIRVSESQRLYEVLTNTVAANPTGKYT